MARTPRASKASDAKASGKTKPAKKTAGKQAATAPTKGAKKKKKATGAPALERSTKKGTGAKKKAAKQSTAAKPAAAPKKAAKKKASSEQAPAAKKKASKKQASSEQAPASKKKAAKKKASSEQASASNEKPVSKKTAKEQASSEQAPAPKKVAKKKPAKQSAASEQVAAPKKATKKKPAEAPVSEQLALDIGTPADAGPAPAGPLQPGDRVPDFSLEADDGQTYSRQSLAGERFVIYFYPKDDTPGCTREACEFRDSRPRFDAAHVKVLGVSSDSLKSHGRFRSKYDLNFPLLADPGRAVAQAFGVVGEKKLYGKTTIGIIRSTFVVGPDGVVERTFSPVKVDGHAEAVLQALGSA